ncbi:MAG: hypothetical protein QOI30_2553 [Mycobacterium sp.]|jgi:hypothetical protein|nr:hypothetical protein [Mycobacterium sp.]MEA3105053.1 hypothetical protein [Caballeronia mineralivorans]
MASPDSSKQPDGVKWHRDYLGKRRRARGRGRPPAAKGQIATIAARLSARAEGVGANPTYRDDSTDLLSLGGVLPQFAPGVDLSEELLDRDGRVCRAGRAENVERVLGAR